jgi:molybdopterin-binding protein
MTDYRIPQVAELLGVSPDTVRRWGEDGRLEIERNQSGHLAVSGGSLAAYLSRSAEAYEPDSVMAQSARNRLTGIVTKVEVEGLVAVVEIHAPPHRLVSMMTREAAEEMELTVGDMATAAVKSTNVIVELPA